MQHRNQTEKVPGEPSAVLGALDVLVRQRGRDGGLREASTISSVRQACFRRDCSR